MTGQELVDAGFHKHRSNHSVLQRWDYLYQRRVRDELGTRYFIDVMEWSLDGRISFEAELNYNGGCKFHPHGRAFMRVTVHSIIDWSTDDIIAWADECWKRLEPVHYEIG